MISDKIFCIKLRGRWKVSSKLLNWVSSDESITSKLFDSLTCTIKTRIKYLKLLFLSQLSVNALHSEI
jgi:hypothetical protein